MTRLSPILLTLALTVAPALAFEDYALKEGMSCAGCHENTRTYVLTQRGRDYLRGGYSFDIKSPATVKPKRPRGPAQRDKPVPAVATKLMTRADELLRDITRTTSLGYYQRAAVAASELQEVAGKIEGRYRAARSQSADHARILRDASFRLERTLRTSGDRRVELVPLYVGRVTGACLRCHAASGISQEDWSRDVASPQVAHEDPRQQHRPHSRTRREEGALPSRKRSWDGARR